MEEAPKVAVPKTSVPFLDADAISGGENGAGAAGMVGGEIPSQSPMVGEHETPAAPCADCAKFARFGYIAGAVFGVAAGSLVAYVILKNRLA